VGLWKNIKKGFGTFSGFVIFEVGDGVRTKFWHNLQCGNTALKEVFPGLFGIPRVTNALGSDNMEVLGDFTQWNVNFVREAHD
jgi:hypothetical protein